MLAGLEREDLEGDGGMLDRLNEVPQLRSLNLGSADDAFEGTGVDDGPQTEVAFEDAALALHPDLGALVDGVVVHLRVEGADHGTGVSLGLQEAGNDVRLEVAGADGVGLDFEEVFAVGGEGVGVYVPPAGFLGLAGQTGEGFDPVGGQAVQLG